MFVILFNKFNVLMHLNNSLVFKIESTISIPLTDTSSYCGMLKLFTESATKIFLSPFDFYILPDVAIFPFTTTILSLLSC